MIKDFYSEITHPVRLYRTSTNASTQTHRLRCAKNHLTGLLHLLSFCAHLDTLLHAVDGAIDAVYVMMFLISNGGFACDKAGKFWIRMSSFRSSLRASI